MEDLMDRYLQAGILPWLRSEKADLLCDAADILLSEGIGAVCLDVSETGLKGLRAIKEKNPEMYLCAEGICTEEELVKAMACGAQTVFLAFFDENLLAKGRTVGADVVVLCANEEEKKKALACGARILAECVGEDFFEKRKAEAGKIPNLCMVLRGNKAWANLGLAITMPQTGCILSERILLQEKEDLESLRKCMKGAKEQVLGFTFAHVGINTPDLESAQAVSGRFEELFGFPAVDVGGNSIYASSALEVMKFLQLGQHGHLAIRSNSVARAAIEMERRGVALAWETKKTDAFGRLHNVYLQEEIGGFAVHFLQRKIWE